MLDAAECGKYLVLKVKYPNCARCSHEGVKVLVLPGVKLVDALKWKRIDPHFRDPQRKLMNEAPSPIARFPGSDAGWNDARAYANWKSEKNW